MKEKKQHFIENKTLILRAIIMFVIGIIAIFADYWLKISNTALNSLVQILFSTVTVIAGLWISCYLLFIQLYKDRYPIKVLKECYLPNMKQNFAIVIFCLVYGSILIVINNGIIANLYYCALCISTVVEIMTKIYNTNKSLMINTYVDKVFQEINDELEKSNNIIKTETFNNIKYILDESIVKEEYFIVQNLTERLGELYRTFLQNSLRFEGENANATEIEKSFDNIVNFNIAELKLCSKINSEITIDKVIKQQIANFNFCIDKNQYEWFKKYIDEYNMFLFKLQKEDNNSPFVEKLYSTYRSIIKRLIEKDKEEWIEYTIEQLSHLIKSLIFFYCGIGIRSYCNLISGAMIFCIDNGKENSKIFNIIFNSFIEFSSLISKNAGAFDKVKLCYSFLFSELLNKGYEKALNFYQNLLEGSFKNSDDPIILEFKMYCVTELIHSSKDNVSQKKILLDKHIKVLTEIISIKDKYDGYLMIPDFESLIKENEYSKDEFKNISDKIFELLNNCIIKDNLPMFYTLFNNLNEILSTTESRQKVIQEGLIDIYIAFIFRTRALVNKQYLEITFQLLENAIKDLDSKRKISSNLGDYIITSISDIAQNGNQENHRVVIKSINLLYSFLDEKEQLAFVVADVNKKKKLYRAMFNIGTDCIENNFEEGLRKVSNSLGWFIINNIEQGNSNLGIYLIERASELYKIANNMEISSKTQTFMLTLFTTVGTFCCKSMGYVKYLNKVLESIADEDIQKIETAISLRTSENDTWNHLFDNKTIELSNEFLDKLKKFKSKK